MGQEGLSCRTIEAAIGRSPSTVSRELRRGLFFAAAVGTAYKPYRAPRRQLGHYSVSITGDIYGHVSDEASAEAMQALVKAIPA